MVESEGHNVWGTAATHPNSNQTSKKIITKKRQGRSKSDKSSFTTLLVLGGSSRRRAGTRRGARSTAPPGTGPCAHARASASLQDPAGPRARDSREKATGKGRATEARESAAANGSAPGQRIRRNRRTFSVGGWMGWDGIMGWANRSHRLINRVLLTKMPLRSCFWWLQLHN